VRLASRLAAAAWNRAASPYGLVTSIAGAATLPASTSASAWKNRAE